MSSSTSQPTTVVIGPKTRYGQALAAELLERGEPVVLVARDAADVAALASVADSGATVVDASTADLTAETAKVAGSAGSVRLAIGALGPIHPHEPAVAADAACVTRDLELVRAVLATGLPTHVVLISTILTLAPGDERRYYGGWKGVVEQQVAHLVDQTRDARLSVLYPGRLFYAPGSAIWKRMHATYRRLVSVTLDLTLDRPRSRVVGIDARIWLAVRSISLALRSLTGSWTRATPPGGGQDVGGWQRHGEV